jgi:hypothetical protein
MKTIKVILFFTGLFLYSIGNAQSVTYGYDEAGNRTNRVIEIPQKSNAPAQEEEATAYSEILADLLIRIYPNPTDGFIRIEIQNLPAGETAHISVYKLSGESVTTKRGVTASTEIDITGQAAGIYLLKIIAGKEQTEWKIIKK